VERIPLLRRWIVGAVIAVVLVVAAGASARSDSIVVLGIRTNGLVTGSGGVRCAASCSIRLERGALVTLYASAPKHFEFGAWSGGCVGAAPTCVLSLDDPATVRATFVGHATTVSLSVGGPGAIVSRPKGIACGAGHDACDAEFPWGTRVSLVARPRTNGKFDSWGGACARAGRGGCTLTVGHVEAVRATFRHAFPRAGLQRLNVELDGRDAFVASKPGGISCPGACTASFPSGTHVRLDIGGDWSGGACASTSLAGCVLVLDAPTTVEVGPSFPHSVTGESGYGMRVSVSGRGTVTAPGIKCGGASGTLSDCDNFFEPKKAVVLKATAAENGQFLGWNFFCKGTKPTCKVFISTSAIVVARFKQ
jgi:hypothetical protein